MAFWGKPNDRPTSKRAAAAAAAAVGISPTHATRSTPRKDKSRTGAGWVAVLASCRCVIRRCRRATEGGRERGREKEAYSFLLAHSLPSAADGSGGSAEGVGE